MDWPPSAEEMEAADNGHSVFAPSSAKMHVTCSASLRENFGKTDPGSPDAAYGTVGHALGEAWLKLFLENRELFDGDIADFAPMERVGDIVEVHSAPGYDPWRVEIDEDMIGYVGQYVRWCAPLEGDHFVETRVSHADLTPIPDQGGTADHAVCSPGLLIITDLKMGRGEAVYPALDVDDPRSLIDGKPNGNPQAMIYAYGFILRYMHKYNFERVIIRIAQPPRDYFGEWETTVAEIYKFAGYYTARAALTWKPNQPRTASLDGCRWCKGKAACGAWLVFWDEMNDGVFEPVIDGEYRDVTAEEVSSAGQNIAVKQAFGTKFAPDPEKLSTHQMEVIKLWRKSFEHFFAALDVELLKRARDGEPMTIFKRGPGRKGNRVLKDHIESDLDFIGIPPEKQKKPVLLTVTELENHLRKEYKLTKKLAELLLSDLVYRADGQDTLMLIRDEREALSDLGSVFEPVDQDLFDL